ncbi:hypothetical protein [Paenibacillus sp. FSL K6-2524]|uniref:hypothetical protein n=1 Tax=Paenibacillus sp. FSL K6-2524 TaxID=2954516 RepID=UPI0030F95000
MEYKKLSIKDLVVRTGRLWSDTTMIDLFFVTLLPLLSAVFSKLLATVKYHITIVILRKKKIAPFKMIVPNPGKMEFGPSKPPTIHDGLSVAKVEEIGEGLNDLRKIKDTNGLRNELPLTESQIKELTDYAQNLGMPKENIRVAGPDDTSPTGLLFDTVLNINNDVLPSNIAGKLSANSKITGNGTIAHEVVGHYESGLARRSFQVIDEEFNVITRNFALDEAQASIRAARFAPELTQADRMMLLRDAISRLRNAGIRIGDVRDLLFIDRR